jgi:DNA-binding MarR family transcriptional regulator
MFDKMKTSSRKESALSSLLVKTTHQRVLALFLAYPARHFYGSEIAKKTRISIGQTSKILGELLRAGVVEKERKGKTELYNLAEMAPELRLFKAMNTVLSIVPLSGRLKPICRMVFLYGSCANGLNTEESDLDLLVVSNNREQVLDAVARFSSRERYGFAEIKPVIKTPAEWAGLETKDPVFFAEVQKGIVLFETRIDESRL